MKNKEVSTWKKFSFWNLSKISSKINKSWKHKIFFFSDIFSIKLPYVSWQVPWKKSISLKTNSTKEYTQRKSTKFKISIKRSKDNFKEWWQTKYPLESTSTQINWIALMKNSNISKIYIVFSWDLFSLKFTQVPSKKRKD